MFKNKKIQYIKLLETNTKHLYTHYIGVFIIHIQWKCVHLSIEYYIFGNPFVVRQKYKCLNNDLCLLITYKQSVSKCG